MPSPPGGLPPPSTRGAGREEARATAAAAARSRRGAFAGGGDILRPCRCRCPRSPPPPTRCRPERCRWRRRWPPRWPLHPPRRSRGRQADAAVDPRRVTPRPAAFRQGDCLDPFRRQEDPLLKLAGGVRRGVAILEANRGARRFSVAGEAENDALLAAFDRLASMPFDLEDRPGDFRQEPSVMPSMLSVLTRDPDRPEAATPRAARLGRRRAIEVDELDVVG